MTPERILARMRDAEFWEFMHWAEKLKCKTMEEAIAFWWLIKQINFN